MNDSTASRCLRFARNCLGMAMLVCLAACSSLLKAPYDKFPSPAILQPISLSSVKDERGDFRRTLCAVAEARKGTYPDEMPCDRMIHDLGGEASGAADSVQPGLHRPANILIVPGIFGECVEEQITPFSDGRSGNDGRKTGHPYAYLESFGYHVDVVSTRGRASSEKNAALVRAKLLDLASSKLPTIVVAYSKGVPDTLAVFPQLKPEEIPKNLIAIVSVAGVAAGTPIADRLDELYESVLSRIPFPSCEPAGSDPVESLSRVERLRKLPFELASIPDRIRLYSVVAFTAEKNVTTALRPFYSMLAASDPHSDGQILYHDAVLPGSRLLGYVNSDHWAIALAFSRAARPAWRELIDHNEFPREVLLESILLQVERDGVSQD